MKQNYKEPEVRIVALQNDVICLSGTTEIDVTDPFGNDPYGVVEI